MNQGTSSAKNCVFYTLKKFFNFEESPFPNDLRYLQNFFSVFFIKVFSITWCFQKFFFAETAEVFRKNYKKSVQKLTILKFKREYLNNSKSYSTTLSVFFVCLTQ